MLINLSDVLSDQHKTVEETVRLEMEEIRMKSGTYPIVSKEPVHVSVEHIRGKELLIKAETRLTAVIPCDRCLEDVRREFVLDITKHVDVGLSDAELTEELDESNLLTDIILTWTNYSIMRFCQSGRKRYSAVTTAKVCAECAARI